MEPITLEELLQATEGKLLTKDADLNTKITSVESDNRKVQNGSVFFAFVGERTDGHKFVDAALKAGACGAVVSRAPEAFLPGKFYVLVEDTIKAVGALAAYYRSKFDIPVVGVTGSVGKTTTKDMIASVLSEKFNVVKTEANFNNNIGLPRTIFRITKDTQIAVIEMGMNHFGEIDYLVNIAKPTVVTITNVGTAHIGNLGSRENIFKAKCEIFDGLAPHGFAVMNGDDDFLPRLKEDAQKQKDFSFAWVGEGKDNDFRAENIQDTLQDEVRYHACTPLGETDITVPAPGRHMIYPTLTAAAIGAHFGMTLEEIRAGIAHYTPTALRMEKSVVGDNILIYNDTYNANPQSMRAGLVTLSHTAGYRHAAVLGDMGELGAHEEELHREVGKAAAQLNLDLLVTVGRASLNMADEARKNGLTNVKSYLTIEEAKAALPEIMQKDTAVLFKASHFMKMEELVQAAKEYAAK